MEIVRRASRWIAAFSDRPIVRTAAPFMLCILYALDRFHFLQSAGTSYDLLIELGGVVLLPLAVHGLMAPFRIDRTSAALIAVLFLFPLLYVGSIRPLLGQISPELGKLRYAAVIISAGPCVLIWHIWRSKKEFRLLYRWMIATLAFLLVVAVAGIILPQARSAAAPQPHSGYGIPQLASVPTDTASRDIVYILMDGHTSAGSLDRLWNYRETEFMRGLERRGFRVSANSKSVSGLTIRSQASTLNMTDDSTLATLPEGAVYDLINRAAVFTFLSSRGYDIRNFSPFAIMENPVYYRVAQLEEPGVSQWMNFFYTTLPIQVLNQITARRLPEKFSSMRNEISSRLKISDDPPAFYYAHFLAPHPPYFYDHTGRLLPASERKPDNDRSGYLENLRGSDTLLLRFIDDILSAAGPKPIIVLQGDHGSRLFGGTDDSWETFTILNAYYLPERDSVQIPANISPYNSFRLIFNSYFGQHLPMLKDGLCWEPSGRSAGRSPAP